ncbi:MAG: hypothetical protein IJ291_00190 [Lachnospiraceae bacterium]|nr:hypothetical protein [Lachnospiraceae bacterium]
MKNRSEWNSFMKTGSVEDYLRYTGCYKEASVDEPSGDKRDVKTASENTDAEFGNGFRNYHQDGAHRGI